MEMQVYLDEQLKQIAPIEGLSFGDIQDKTTWKINFSSNATPEQRRVARTFLDRFEWNDELRKRMRKKHRNHDMRGNPVVKWCFQQYRNQFPGQSFSDFLDYCESITIGD